MNICTMPTRKDCTPTGLQCPFCKAELVTYTFRVTTMTVCSKVAGHYHEAHQGRSQMIKARGVRFNLFSPTAEELHSVRAALLTVYKAHGVKP